MNGKEEDAMEMTFAPDQLCAMARSRERESAWGRAFLLLLLIGIGGASAYNVLTASQLWVGLSQGWMLVWSGWLVWSLGRGAHPRSATESCVSFLRREYETKRSGMLAFRRYVFWLVPPIAASWWWGGGQALRLTRLKALGVDSGSRLYEFARGPWPFVISILLLVVIWLAFGLAAKKAERELEELERRAED